MQIECFKSQEMVSIMGSNFVIIGKPPASTTKITQPCDFGNCFRGPKRNLASAKHNNNDLFKARPNTFLIDVLQICRKEHGERMKNGVLSTKGTKNSTPQQKMAVKGLIRVQSALMNCIHSGTIINSFGGCGIHPYDLTRMLQNCTTRLSSDQEQNIVNQMNALKSKILEQGEIFDADFDTLNIARDNSGKSKDNLIVSRRRSCILTHLGFIERERIRNEAVLESQRAKAARKIARNLRKTATASTTDLPPDFSNTIAGLAMDIE